MSPILGGLLEPEPLQKPTAAAFRSSKPQREVIRFHVPAVDATVGHPWAGVVDWLVSAD